METTTMTTTSLDLPAARQARDGLATLLRAERGAAADFLRALADFDHRRGWERLGHASLFAFLYAELGLSTAATFWRMSAARLLQRFPELIEPLRDGRLCLTTTAELAKVLTAENRAEVLPRFFGSSAREAKELVAELLPREAPPVKTVVTGLERREPAPQPPLSLQSARPEASASTPAPISLWAPEMGTTHPAWVTGRRDEVEPLTAELRRLHVTVSRGLLEKVARARDGLSHALPGATTEQVLEAALDLLLEHQAKARGHVKRPRARFEAAAREPSDAETAPAQQAPPLTLLPVEPPPPRRTGPREAIPAAVRRAVWERDDGRCAWPLDGGGCCGSTHRLQLDHIVPWARGGTTTVENLRITCAIHNRLAARQAFGSRWMGRYAVAPA